MKKSIAVVLIMVVVLVSGGCWEPDLNRPDLERYITFKVMGDSTNVQINSEQNIDLTAGPYKKTIKIIAEKINENDPAFTEWVFPTVYLRVEDFSGSYTMINCEIWDEATGKVESDGVITEPFEYVTLSYKPDLRP